MYIHKCKLFKNINYIFNAKLCKCGYFSTGIFLSKNTRQSHLYIKMDPFATHIIKTYCSFRFKLKQD